MFDALRNLFRMHGIPTNPFVDPVLGQFAFERTLGWTTRITMGQTQADLVLGSDGEPPSNEMLETAKRWVDEWDSHIPKILDYVRSELLDASWSEEPNLPDPELLVVQSINILWPDEPKVTMMYFDYPDDDRAWYVTFDGLEPRIFLYDH